jgi:hypothetical protein
MAICSKCKTNNREGAAVCRVCGQALVKAAPGPRMCAAGLHPMDPSWTDCPYCRNTPAPKAPQGEALRHKTVSEKPLQGPPPAAPPTPRGGRRAATQFMAETPEVTAPETSRPHAARKIVAILVTRSWKPEGQLFALFEGRNFIGSDPSCEILLDTDPQMSGKHATIVYRGGTFLLDDANSMNGTFLEGRDVLEKTILENYANIRTGATNWTFIAISPGKDE